MSGGPIVAIGGVEFSMRPENDALHDYVLSLTEAARPKVCLLPTASGDPREHIRAFQAAMDRRRCETSSISLFRLGETELDVRGHLLEQDLIYATGGNMVNLMALWREHGLDRVLRSAHEQGTILCGYSAGSMCWFEQGVSRGVGRPVPTTGMGLLAGSHCVHYSQDPPRRLAYRSLIGAGEVRPGLALDDHAAALFLDGELREVVSSHASARGFLVERDGNGGVTEQALPVRDITPHPRTSDSALEERRAVDEMRRLRRARNRRA